MYRKFTKRVLCDKDLKRFEKSKDPRIKQYFDLDHRYQNFEELNVYYEFTPFNVDKKMITPKIRKFIQTSQYRYPKCILRLFKNYPSKTNTLPSTSNEHVGLRAVTNDSRHIYYKFMLSHMTGLSKNKDIIRRVVSEGLNEHRNIVNELKKFNETPKILKSFKSFKEVKTCVKKIMHDIISICKYDFPKMDDIHKKLPRIHVHRSKPGEPKAYYVLPSVTCKYTRGNPNQRGKVVIQLTSLHNVDICDLTLILVHEVIPGHFYEFHNYPSDFYVSPYWFNEGWGLYVEKWIDRLGDSYKKTRLIERLLRATRCIIDPYIHTKNKSLTDCIDKMYKLMCGHMTRDACKQEVLRYICNPGQACSYLNGCKFIERMAKKRGRMSLYDFHDLLLRIGPGPMKYVKKKLLAGK
jgi:uncharacterized protein (DUF885 family)